MPVLKAGESPPDDYYAQILKSLVSTVVDQYDDILAKKEKEVALAILSLRSEPLRLLARIATRTRTPVRLDSLSYREVRDQEKALSELTRAGLITVNGNAELDGLLTLLTVQELKHKFPQSSKAKTKPRLLESIQEHYGAKEICDLVAESPGWVHLSSERELALFKCLFFGNPYQDLSEFVVRDLGITQFENYTLNKKDRFFNTRAMLDRFLELHEFAELIHEHGLELTAEIAKSLLDSLNQAETDRLLERRRCRILNTLGRQLERLNENDLALTSYRCSTSHPSRERTMRIHAKQKQPRKVESLREEILKNPYSLKEQLFATNFGRKRSGTANIPMVERQTPASTDQRIEEFAVAQLSQEGSVALHLENVLPNALFGLTYWEWIFAPVRGAFTHPFQIAPLDIYWPEFFDVRRQLQPDPLQEPELLKEHIKTIAIRKRNINNAFVSWSKITTDLLTSILDSFPIDQLISLLQVFSTDIRQFQSGFPDLTVIDGNGSIQFVEVKGPGDQVRPNQRLWLEQMVARGIPTSVLKYR